MADTTKSLKGTQTEKNIATTYAVESTAFTRYTYYAQTAQKEQYFQVAEIFNETAANELHHAKIMLKYLEEGVTTAPLAIDKGGALAPTADNLAIAIKEEEVEGKDAYLKAAEVADEEGFPEIADRFRAIAAAESHHRERFMTLLKRIQDGTMWKRDTPIKWQCMVCGYIFEGTQPPEKCPACYHPYQHFMPEETNF